MLTLLQSLDQSVLVLVSDIASQGLLLLYFLNAFVVIMFNCVSKLLYFA